MNEFNNLLEIITVLRSPKGCPWDRAQKIKDMKKYLLEEAYELIDAIDKKQAEIVKEELGDIFLILVVIAQMHKEKNKFGIKDVFERINKKLISRHPHVFSSVKLETKEEVLNHWVRSKAKRKKRKSIKDRLPLNAPSLLLANVFLKERAYLDKRNHKTIQKKDISKIKNKLNSLGENKDKEKPLTDIMYEICKLGFSLGVDLEGSLRQTILKQAGRTQY